MVAKRIRVFLAEYNIKQVAVAEAIGMSTAAFSKRISGKQAIDLDAVERISEALGVQPGVFLTGETPRPPTDPGDGADRWSARDQVSGRSSVQSRQEAPLSLVA
jgi:transcriptional regulator with XRE-family HTH domain